MITGTLSVHLPVLDKFNGVDEYEDLLLVSKVYSCAIIQG